MSAYRQSSHFPAPVKEALRHGARDWWERYLDVEEILADREPAFLPPVRAPSPVAQPDDVEAAAVALRDDWRLGLAPIENLTELLEDYGIKIGIVRTPRSLHRLRPQSRG